MNSLHNHRDGIFNILLPRIVNFQTIMVVLLFVMMARSIQNRLFWLR